MVARACFGIGLILSAAAIALPPSSLHAAHAKIALVKDDRALPGSSVSFTSAELAAYASEQAAIAAPGALRNLSLNLTPAHAETTAYINFLKVRQAEGESDNWLVRQLLDGERKVTVRVRFASRSSQARVDVEKVEVEGISMQGNTLDFLLRQFVIPSFPEAQVGRWFPLGHNIERLDVTTGAATLAIRK